MRGYGSKGTGRKLARPPQPNTTKRVGLISSPAASKPVKIGK